MAVRLAFGSQVVHKLGTKLLFRSNKLKNLLLIARFVNEEALKTHYRVTLLQRLHFNTHLREPQLVN